jgi:DNA-directed RNA polymerase subunit omega
MIEANYDELLKKVDSKYTLVIASAKRARQILDGAPLLLSIDYDKKTRKPVTIALQEIAADKIKYERLDKKAR